MEKGLIFTGNYLKYQFQKKYRDPALIRDYLENHEYIPGKRTLSAEEINKNIGKKIESKVPFMVGRFGATELSALKTIDFKLKKNYHKIMQQMQMWSGFFPASIEYGKQFKELMISSIPYADVIGVWMQPFEDYYIKNYGSCKVQFSYLLDLEPWSAPYCPWTVALKGKKVLIIHPFVDTITKQYAKRELLFPGTDILPEFELKTLKAVQTIAGEQDDRFATWFEALEWMYQEAIRTEFDVAIIGCGAYGFPLAAMLKKSGKQALHLAGATQLLFGIKGKRWENHNAFTYVQKFFNDSWCYPNDAERPLQSKKVENNCYW